MPQTVLHMPFRCCAGIYLRCGNGITTDTKPIGQILVECNLL